MIPIKQWPMWQKLIVLCLSCVGIAYGIALLIEFFSA